MSNNFEYPLQFVGSISLAAASWCLGITIDDAADIAVKLSQTASGVASAVLVYFTIRRALKKDGKDKDKLPGAH